MGRPLGERFSFAGEFYSVTDSPGLPKPVQRPHPPILLGGRGPRRTPQLTARYADEFNVPFSGVEDTRAAFGRVREACQAAGRDPASLVYSAAHTVCCGRDEAELARRAGAIGWDLATQRADGLVGTPDEIVDRIGTYAGLGATRMYLQVMDLHDLDHLELIASEVLPSALTRPGPAAAAGPRSGARRAELSLLIGGRTARWRCCSSRRPPSGRSGVPRW